MNIRQTYIKLLKEFISFKSVSTDIKYQKEMTDTVSWLVKLFKANKFTVTIIKGKNSNPVVIARYKTDPSLKTFLVYGHYDVQPAQKSDGWKTDPFKLSKQGSRYVGRGVVDNKGQILAHMVAVFDAIQRKTLTANVTFMIEGNEESGNDDLPQIIQKNKKLLLCDAVIISDGEMIQKYPVLDVSFRGGGNIRLTYMSSTNDRHSGLYGGAIPNAALELSKLLAKLKINNKVSFPSFYNSLLPISQTQRKMGKRLGDIQSIQDTAQVQNLVTEEGYSGHVQIGLRPTIEVSGFNSGYTGAGFKNIIPGMAEARLNVRTVYPQSTKKVMKEIEQFIRKETPRYIDLDIQLEPHGDPISIDVNNNIIKDIKKLLYTVYKKEVFYQHVGGSIPVVADFTKVLQKPIAMVSLGNDDCNMHGVDENFSEYHMNKALKFTTSFWSGV